MQITVVGSGYVGLVAGACFADIGHKVILVENDPEKLAALQKSQVPIHEKFLSELLKRHRGKRLIFSADLRAAVRASEVIFIAAGTPSNEHGEVDLSYVESVARSISSALNGYKVLVEKSTVPVYNSDWVRKIILRNAAPPDSFDVASNPEFLREGTAVSDFLYPDRIVLGCDSERATALLRKVYAPLSDGSYYKHKGAIPQPDSAVIPPPVIVTSAKSAELIKHASNAFLAMKISFVNAVASICESAGANVQQVCQGIGTDRRIGPRFLSPGIGYGGSCLPKDLMAFRAIARGCGYEFRLLDEVKRINEDQRHRFMRKIHSALWTLRGKRLGALGLAFKGGTDDIRESPAIVLLQSLIQEGCQIAAYDPAAAEQAKGVLNGNVEFVGSSYDAAQGADALLILTDWEEFAALDWKRIHGQMKDPIVIDGRNLCDPEVLATQGFTYYSVGRAMATAEISPAAARPAPRKLKRS
jgi:UDPglucose 6-dehydrogenase